MSRLNPVDPANVTGKSKDQLNAMKSALGFDPNMTKGMVNSPAVLDAYMSFSGALGKGKLNAKVREAIALAVAQQNHCDYCLSAHTAIGKVVGLKEDEILAIRKGTGADEYTTAGLTFAKRVLETRGQVTDADLGAVRAAGLSDGEVAEIIAHVALNVFTNYFNIATDVEIDFPKVSYAAVA